MLAARRCMRWVLAGCQGCRKGAGMTVGRVGAVGAGAAPRQWWRLGCGRTGTQDVGRASLLGYCCCCNRMHALS
jgi:hypothetical protein